MAHYNANYFLTEGELNSKYSLMVATVKYVSNNDTALCLATLKNGLSAVGVYRAPESNEFDEDHLKGLAYLAMLQEVCSRDESAEQWYRKNRIAKVYEIVNKCI